MEILDTVFYGNSILKWLIAGIILTLAYGGIEILRFAAARRLVKRARTTPGLLDDFIVALLKEQTKSIFIIIFALYLSSRFLILPPYLLKSIRVLAVIALALQALIWSNGAVNYIIEERKRRLMEEDPGSVSAFSAVSFISKAALFAIILLLALNNLGVNITALVAGLGVGGIAVALAIQNILGDLFASVSIVLDKPFVVGDYIVIGDYMGDVEHIGVKTTRIRSLSGEQIVLANTDLLQSRVRNYKRMRERRAEFSFGVTYQTPDDKLASIPDIIREIVEARKITTFARCHFSEFGDYSLVFETVYYVNDPDYMVYMDVQQTINMETFKRFKELGIEFAYPTRTNYQIKMEPGANA